MFNCAPHFDYKTTFTPRLNQAYLVDFQSYYVRICSYTVDPFLIFEKGSPEGNPVGGQKRTFAKFQRIKKVCKSRTYTLSNSCELYSAESEGFEPPDLLQSTVFKTAAIDHSANSPLKTFVSFSVVQI